MPVHFEVKSLEFQIQPAMTSHILLDKELHCRLERVPDHGYGLLVQAINLVQLRQQELIADIRSDCTLVGIVLIKAANADTRHLGDTVGRQPLVAFLLQNFQASLTDCPERRFRSGLGWIPAKVAGILSHAVRLFYDHPISRLYRHE
ncbi:hypothetical protein D3C80_1434230 [compost metagenome]